MSPKTIEEEIHEIKERNRRVESDKAWETSWFRKILIALLTYSLAVALLYVIDVEQPLSGALIPAVGYIISTFTLGPIKKEWKKHYENFKNQTDEADIIDKH